MSAAHGPAAAEAGAETAEDKGSGAAYDWLAEAALASVTVVAAVGMSRLFVDTSFLRDVLALALAAHVVAAAVRRAGLSAVSAALVSMGCFGITATVLRYGETAWFVLPTADTLAAARVHLVDSWRIVNASPAPVVPAPGLVLSAGAVLGLCAFLADAAAFRRRAAVSAVVPTSAVYGFTAAAGTGDGAVRHAALYCSAVGAAMVVLWLRKRRTDAWIEARRGLGVHAMARAAGAALLLAVVAGAVAGPSLPGAKAEPWVDLARLAVTEAAPWVEVPSPDPEPWVDFGRLEGAGAADSLAAAALGSGEAPRFLVSPLVQVQSRLIELSERELFTVSVPEEDRQYWRLTSLDEFDGNSWRARSQYEEVSGPVAATVHPSATGPSLVQTVRLTGLGNAYLPVAYELREVVNNGRVEMEYEASSASLIKARRASIEGPGRFTYVVDSVVRKIDDPDVLRNVETSLLEAGFLAFNTGLPDDVRDLVRGEAERVTADARSDYHRALELQDYFRLDGGFRYDLEVHANEGIDSLEEFLFDVKAGYCQQFASAFAAMARSVGLPTRVAVGFTWGEWDPERGEVGAYVVRGKHAHAWPEVYFAGTGWVRFEPTPGRGAPGDFAVTGHVADQDGLDTDEAVGDPQEGAEPDEPPGSAGRPDSAEQRSDTATEGPATGSEPGEGLGTAVASSSRVWNLVLLSALLLAAAVLALALVPVLRRTHRGRSRARLANDPAGLIDLRWSEALEALELVQFVPRPFETPLEVARRATSMRPDVGPIEELAVLATHGRYARQTSKSMAVRAGVVASLVIVACRRQANLLRRFVAGVDPSTLFLRRRPR